MNSSVTTQQQDSDLQSFWFPCSSTNCLFMCLEHVMHSIQLISHTLVLVLQRLQSQAIICLHGLYLEQSFVQRTQILVKKGCKFLPDPLSHPIPDVVFVTLSGLWGETSLDLRFNLFLELLLNFILQLLHFCRSMRRRCRLQ